MGLTRRFAGAPCVVAALREIDDRTTADVMKRLFEGMLARGERSVAASRAVHAALWKTKGLEAPYYWGAVTLQGDWR